MTKKKATGATPAKKRVVKKIILHCSDSDRILHNDVQVIKQWHKARGFKTVGYHYFIRRDGTVQGGRKPSEIGAHVKGHNADSIGICLAGSKVFYPQQFRALAALCRIIADKYDLAVLADIYGHNDFTDLKTCPNFDVGEFVKKYLDDR